MYRINAIVHPSVLTPECGWGVRSAAGPGLRPRLLRELVVLVLVLFW